VRHADAYGAPELVTHGELLDALVKQPGRLLQVMGVRHVIARPGSLPRGFPLRRRMDRLGVSINDAAGLPFAHPVGRVVVAPDRPAVLRRMADPAFPLRRAAVFEGATPLPTYKEAARREAVLMHHQAGAIELELDFEEPGYLVVLESHYPGWQATVGGKPRRLYRANGAFLGLRVPRGKHQVMLTFAPRRQLVGLWVSGGSLLLLLVVAVVVVVRRRRLDPLI
jgi:hypothetical protein